MKPIQTYNNLKHELEIEKSELSILLDKKDELHSKYFKITSTPGTEILKNHSMSDKFANYMIELTKNTDNFPSLQESIEKQSKIVEKLEKSLSDMTANLVNLQGIEYELYSQIIVKNGNLKSGQRPSITRAVERTAEIYNVNVRTVWRVYNKKIKNLLKCQWNVSKFYDKVYHVEIIKKFYTPLIFLTKLPC